MTHASLFSGIGGFDLAAEWAGWDNVFHCEWNPFGQKVLKHHFPKSISYNDITKTDFTIHRGAIDIISGGFPCQPYSSAGKRLGTADERHLWPHMLRTIQEVQPSWVVGENVRGLTNWNGGVVFDEVQAELEAEGYEVTPFLLPACAVNAPHRRDRIWFVAFKNANKNGRGSEQRKKESSKWEFRNACPRDNERIRTNNEEIKNAPNPNSNGQQRINGEHEINPSEGGEYAQCYVEQMGEYDATDTSSRRVQRNRRKSSNNRFQTDEFITDNSKRQSFVDWQNFPTQPPICGGDDGLPKELDNITFSKWRQESIKAYGNAIVPQVAYQIFKAINQYNL